VLSIVIFILKIRSQGLVLSLKGDNMALEIIGIVKRLGPIITEERKQTIELSNVVSMVGDFCQGEQRKIVFLNPEEAKKYDEMVKESKVVSKEWIVNFLSEMPFHDTDRRINHIAKKLEELGHEVEK